MTSKSCMRKPDKNKLVCYKKRSVLQSIISFQLPLINIKMFFFSLKDGTSLIINNFEIPTVFACKLAEKKCGNFKIVDD